MLSADLASRYQLDLERMECMWDISQYPTMAKIDDISIAVFGKAAHCSREDKLTPLATYENTARRVREMNNMSYTTYPEGLNAIIAAADGFTDEDYSVTRHEFEDKHPLFGCFENADGTDFVESYQDAEDNIIVSSEEVAEENNDLRDLGSFMTVPIERDVAHSEISPRDSNINDDAR